MLCSLLRACGAWRASSSSVVTLLLLLVSVHLSDSKTLPGESHHLHPHHHHHHQQPGESHHVPGEDHPSSQHGERTTPFCMVDGHKRSLSQALQSGHPDRLECVVQFGGTFYSLDLDKNHGLLPKPPNVFYYLPNGTGVSMETDPVTLCYYHGSVRGFPHSRVALSTCSGLRGIVALNSTLTFELQPDEGEGERGGGEESGGGEEVEDVSVRPLYPTSPPEGSPGPEASCGVSHSPVPPLHATAHTHRRKRDILSETKYIELVLVADHQEYLNYQRNNKTIIYRMLDVANQVDWFYRALNVRVALTGVEIWSDRDKIDVDRSPAETLSRFLDWRTRELLPRLRHDNAQLVMGESFGGTTVGMASQSSMCSRDRSGGVNVDHLVSVLGVASTVAHELGHNLGMSHDTAERRCHCDNEPRMGGCIMEPSTGLMPGQQFSSCSASDLSLSLLHGGGMCLFNVPQPDRLMGGPRCGNLYVERGEECDCGLIEECDDPCCNASTCKLVPGAQCSSDGICCNNCKLRTAGWVCREPLGECDLSEHCTGTSPYCPPNVYLQNGELCEDAASYCWGGVCASLSAQCRTLWGANSTQAPAVCFSSVNKQGNKYGNCGQLTNGSYVPCSSQDVMCGRIQCQGGAERPLLGTHAEVTRAHFGGISHQGGDLVCRGVYFHLGDDVSDPATVAQGTACAPGKACVNQVCQDVSVFGVEECRSKCNGHGVCNSNLQCHCEVGWAPPDCVYAGHGGSVDSGPARATRESGAVHIALLVVFLFIVPVILLFLILRFPRCRHRLLCLRDSAPFHKTARQHNRTPALERVESRNGDQVRPLRYHWNGQGDIPMTTTVHGRPAPPTKPLPPDPDFKKPQLRVKQRPAPPAKPLPPDPYAPTNQSARSRPAPPSKPLPPDPQDSVPLKPLLPRKPPQFPANLHPPVLQYPPSLTPPLPQYPASHTPPMPHYPPSHTPPLPQYPPSYTPPLPQYPPNHTPPQYPSNPKPGCSTASAPLQQHGDNGPALPPNRGRPLPPSRPPHLKKPNASPRL